MTTPGYPSGCPAGSEVPGIALAPRGYAFNVDLNNGNVNRNHQSNHNSALPCRPGECQGVTFRQIHTARRAAGRRKKPSRDQLQFNANWLDRQIELLDSLNDYSWRPSAPLCFIARSPKAREIHAPPFADRVVHWTVVPPLEAHYERIFINASYSNRRGKGTHAAVRQLHGYVRQVHSGQGGGFFLQLDIKSFFPSVRRPTLYGFLRARMERAGLPMALRRAVHALLTWPISRTGVRWACTPAEREAVPAHKRLENAPPGCGLAIGNLSSQFFANVYLNELDQFVKHVLKARRYVRYVDDFVLVHQSREQLQAWRGEIQVFLQQRLQLELKSEQKLLPLTAGIDFLGYVIYPTHRVVRRRVISHCRAKLAEFERRGDFSPRARRRLRSVWASYEGHFRHASSWRLRQRIHARFPWLAEVLA